MTAVINSGPLNAVKFDGAESGEALVQLAGTVEVTAQIPSFVLYRYIDVVSLPRVTGAVATFTYQNVSGSLSTRPSSSASFNVQAVWKFIQFAKSVAPSIENLFAITRYAWQPIGIVKSANPITDSINASVRNIWKVIDATKSINAATPNISATVHKPISVLSSVSPYSFSAIGLLIPVDGFIVANPATSLTAADFSTTVEAPDVRVMIVPYESREMRVV